MQYRTLDPYSEELVGTFDEPDSAITAGRKRGLPIAAALETGMTFIDNGVADEPAPPFGGVKASGFGRELSNPGSTEFANHKLTTIA
jgi:acyl-CoA reductase-like NAD-dependent aldehyde dehydrogenase